MIINMFVSFLEKGYRTYGPQYTWFTTIYIYFQMKIINTKEMFKNLATYNCFYDCIIIDIKY